MVENKVAQEVTQMTVRLEKACSKKESAAVVDILKALDKIEMTAEIFKISKVVFAVKKCKSGEGLESGAKERASGLISKWKKMMKAGGGGSDAASTASDGPMSPISRETSTSSVKSEASAPAKDTASKAANGSSDAAKGGEAAKEVPTVESFMLHKNEGVPAQRLRVQNLFFKSFLKFLPPDDTKAAMNAAYTAMTIEHAIHGAFDPQGDQKQQYSEKVRSLKSNLEANADLRQEVLNANVTGEELVKMTPEQMQSEEMKRQAAETRKYAAEEANPDISEYRDKVRQNFGLQSEGGSFQCRRCKGVKTSHYAKQTRSSDEPMTMFITCETCGLRWKEN